MSNRFILSVALTSLFLIILSACAGNPAGTSQPPTEQAETEPAMPTQTTPPEPSPTQEPTGPAAVEKTVYVGPALVDCQGVAPQKCMQVKENPEDEYSFFYGQIEGFEYEEGNEYQLIVREEKIKNPPADAPNLKWTLVEIVSQSPVEATTTPEGALSLEGLIFSLDWYVDTNGEQVQVLPGTEVTAEFKDGMIAGSTGCNRYTGSYEINGDQIKIEGFITTLIACLEPVMQQEMVYLEVLKQAASYDVSDGTLTLLDAEGNAILSYTVVQPLSLTGTHWEATGYNNGKGGFTSLISGTHITAIFGEDGNLSGLAGCNRYNAAYSVDGESITIGPAISTRMFCGEPEGLMEQESAYLLALERASKFEIQGDILTVRDADEAMLAQYAANPLIGKTWSLDEIQYMDGTTKASDDPAKYTVEFLPDGTLNIQADCNTAGGEYTLSDSSVAISITHTTRAACPPESLSEEFFQNLGIAATYLFEGDALYIATQMDVAILKFQPVQ